MPTHQRYGGNFDFDSMIERKSNQQISRVTRDPLLLRLGSISANKNILAENLKIRKITYY